jgi:hypothetical protein
VSTGNDGEKVPFSLRRRYEDPLARIRRVTGGTVPGLYKPGTKPPPEKNPFGPAPAERTTEQPTDTSTSPPRARAKTAGKTAPAKKGTNKVPHRRRHGDGCSDKDSDTSATVPNGPLCAVAPAAGATNGRDTTAGAVASVAVDLVE